MSLLPLRFRGGHLFLEVDGGLWVVDTGAPASFGAVPSVRIAGHTAPVRNSFFGLDASTLSRYVGVQCSGLLGADVLGELDIVFDVPDETASISTGALVHDGSTVALEEVMGLPIVSVASQGVSHRMFFDTGAKISYYQDESLSEYPSAGPITDFYPGVGQFQTETHLVDLTIGGMSFALRCGSLPGPLAATLMIAGVNGIVGNEILTAQPRAYFPRRHLLVL